METEDHHVYMVLTKRSERMLKYLLLRYRHGLMAPSNIIVGVSVERQREANQRISDLMSAPVHVKYLTFFALLEPIDLNLIPGVEGGLLSTVRQIMVGGIPNDSSQQAKWYADIRTYFENLDVLVTDHILSEEVEQRGF